MPDDANEKRRSFDGQETRLRQDVLHRDGFDKSKATRTSLPTPPPRPTQASYLRWHVAWVRTVTGGFILLSSRYLTCWPLR